MTLNERRNVYMCLHALFSLYILSIDISAVVYINTGIVNCYISQIYTCNYTYTYSYSVAWQKFLRCINVLPINKYISTFIYEVSKAQTIPMYLHLYMHYRSIRKFPCICAHKYIDQHNWTVSCKPTPMQHDCTYSGKHARFLDVHGPALSYGGTMLKLRFKLNKSHTVQSAHLKQKIR